MIDGEEFAEGLRSHAMPIPFNDWRIAPANRALSDRMQCRRRRWGRRRAAERSQAMVSAAAAGGDAVNLRAKSQPRSSSLNCSVAVSSTPSATTTTEAQVCQRDGGRTDDGILGALHDARHERVVHLRPFEWQPPQVGQ